MKAIAKRAVCMWAAVCAVNHCSRQYSLVKDHILLTNWWKTEPEPQNYRVILVVHKYDRNIKSIKDTKRWKGRQNCSGEKTMMRHKWASIPFTLNA